MVEMKLNRNDPEGQERSYRMKKAIAILLVLLVAGTAFGDNPQIVLESTMGVKTNHGFYIGTSYTNFGQVFSAIFEDQTVDDLDMEIDVAQSVGNYAFATNARTAVNVTLTTFPLVGPGGTYVPYSLSATKDAGTIGEGSLTINFLAGSTVGTDEIAEASGNLLNQTAATNGPKWATYSLGVTFNGSDNLAYGLPQTAEGDIYSGWVKASITVN